MTDKHHCLRKINISCGI